MKSSSFSRWPSKGFLGYVSTISIRSSFRLVLSAITLFVSSCAHRMESTGLETSTGRSFDAPRGKALICVYRPSKPFTGLMKRPVFINKQHVASTKLGSFVAVPVEPGTYTVQAASQALIDSPAYRQAYPDIRLKLTAGQTVFIRQTVGALTSNSGSPPMMLYTGGSTIPIPFAGGLPPFGAVRVDGNTGRSECSGLKQVIADPLEAE